MTPSIHLTCNITCICASRYGDIVCYSHLWSRVFCCIWIIYRCPSLYYVISGVSTIYYVFTSCCLLYVFPIRTRAVFILHRCGCGIYCECVMSIIHFSHFRMTPSIHLTCKITCMCTCRYGDIVNNT